MPNVWINIIITILVFVIFNFFYILFLVFILYRFNIFFYFSNDLFKKKLNSNNNYNATSTTQKIKIFKMI